MGVAKVMSSLLEKHFELRISILLGINIDCCDESEKKIRINL
jgi:hypothetical protein